MLTSALYLPGRWTRAVLQRIVQVGTGRRPVLWLRASRLRGKPDDDRSCGPGCGLVRLSTVKGALIGASLTYLLDPQLGPMRRALLSERIASLSRIGRASMRDRMRLGGPGQWEEPMVIVQIDVDGQNTLPGWGHRATLGPLPGSNIEGPPKV